jgi:predicted ester cyclase
MGLHERLQQSEEHKAAARAAFQVWSTGELDLLDRHLHPDVVHHDPYDPNGRAGLAGMKRSITDNRHRYPDLRFTVEDQIAEGDKVATRWTASMTREGRPVTFQGITIDRFEHGRIVEAWRSMDMLGLLRQSGERDSG